MADQHRIVSPSLLLLSALVAMGGCSRAPHAGGNAQNAASAMPTNQSGADPGAIALRSFASAVGTVRLTVPPGAQVSRDLNGRALMTQGWRLDWMGKPVGIGTALVRLSITARPTTGPGQVDEMVQVGASRDADAVRDCLFYGLAKPGDQSTDKRRVGGVGWTVYHHRDAGMSQQIEAQDLRAVVDGTCWAVARISYAIKAAEPLPATAPPQAKAAAAMDAALASLKVNAPG